MVYELKLFLRIIITLLKSDRQGGPEETVKLSTNDVVYFEVNGVGATSRTWKFGRNCVESEFNVCKTAASDLVSGYVLRVRELVCIHQ